MGGLPFFSFLFSYASVLNTCISIVHVHVYICFYTRICTLLWCTCMLRLWDPCIYACTCSLLVCVYLFCVLYYVFPCRIYDRRKLKQENVCSSSCTCSRMPNTLLRCILLRSGWCIHVYVCVLVHCMYVHVRVHVRACLVHCVYTSVTSVFGSLGE